ncbi:MAG: hypothetical protein ABI430_02615 [Candidatus Taylorbacteria bacterium]
MKKRGLLWAKKTEKTKNKWKLLGGGFDINRNEAAATPLTRYLEQSNSSTTLDKRGKR